MFTSRSEFRLILRAENADFRLTPRAIELGLVCDERKRMYDLKEMAFKSSMAGL